MCLKEMESVCVFERERECACVSKREGVNDRECLRERIWVQERCECVKENVSVRVSNRVYARETENM